MIRDTVVYGTAHGASLLADIAVPKADGPHPVILSVHGGRWIRGARHDQANGAIDVAQWAELGFFAMPIDYRLVTGAPAPACFQDLMCAIRWVHAHADTYNLDRSRLFLIGMSAGGHMVSLAATAGNHGLPRTGGWEDAADDFTAAISVSGAYDLVSLSWGGSWCPPGVDWHSARTAGSPIHHVSAQSKPLLLLHSDDDTSVPVQQAIQMAQTLADHGAPHTFAHFTDRGHMPITPLVIEHALAFIATHSPG